MLPAERAAGDPGPVAGALLDRRRHEIAEPDEVGHKAGDRAGIDLAGDAFLGHQSGLHDDHAIAHHHRFGLIVGHVNGRNPELLLDLGQLEAHALPELGVEIAERLVEQQEPRLHDQGARQRHPLLLPAGELVRIAVVVAGEADDAELLFDKLANLVLLMLALHLQRIGDVVEHGHMRPDGIGLEDHAEVPAVGRYERLRGRVGDHLAVDADPSLTGLLETRRCSAGSSSCRSRWDRAGRRTRQARP